MYINYIFQGSLLFDFRRLILTSKVDPRAERGNEVNMNNTRHLKLEDIK